MTPERAAEITRARFAEWATLLESLTATPMLVIAVAHGAHSDDLHMITPDGVTDAEIGNVLARVWREVGPKSASTR